MGNKKKRKKSKEVLYIQPNEKINLPKRYRNINNICAIIYDQLTEIYKLENYKPLFESEIIRPEFEKLKDEFERDEIHLLDWLKENGAVEEITIILTKHLVTTITSDFINFIYEALRNAKYGKMTVAYALIRKPLTDELLILEQLLVDKEDFINRFFMEGETKKYDPSNRKIDKHAITKKALEKLNLKALFSDETIYKVRYDKSCEYGLNGLTNQALHIVTNDFHYRTHEQNLNFVFSVEDDIKRYREHFYNFVPYLLIYAVCVIDRVIFELLDDKDNQNLKYVKELRRLVGFMLFNKDTKAISKKRLKKMFKIIGEGMPRKCENCKHLNTIEYADFVLFMETEIFICQKCFSNLIATPESIQSIKNFFSGFVQPDE